MNRCANERKAPASFARAGTTRTAAATSAVERAATRIPGRGEDREVGNALHAQRSLADTRCGRDVPRSTCTKVMN